MNPPEIARVLEGVFDPELGIDIVSLGLVYGIATGSGRTHIDLALTSPDCPMGEAIAAAAARALAAIEPGAEVEFEIVDEPPWSVAMLNEAARLQLGLAPHEN